MIDHGYFSINHAASDLYLMDLKTRTYHKLDINSGYNESYHCLSWNVRWFVFSSKRLDNVFSRPYFSHFDKEGRAPKPFLLPQKDPLFYDSFLHNFNIPELVGGEVPLNTGMIRVKRVVQLFPGGYHKYYFVIAVQYPEYGYVIE